jgi:hypothetical protein
MDVHIGEMNSTVQMTDSQALLSPQILEQIVRIVLQRVRDDDAHRARVEDERRLRPGVTAKEATTWE